MQFSQINIFLAINTVIPHLTFPHLELFHYCALAPILDSS